MGLKKFIVRFTFSDAVRGIPLEKIGATPPVVVTKYVLVSSYINAVQQIKKM